MTSYALLFPGQGSQSVGMLDAWAQDPAAQAVVHQALEEASQALGEDLGALIKDGPKEALALTTNTQPVMLVAGVAAYRVWQAAVDHAPSVVAGHSLGEYSALVAAGVLSLGDATRIVRARAQAMQEAVPVSTGAMAAVLGMAAADVVAICAQSVASGGGVAEAVNFNDPGQTVIAGSKAGVEAASVLLKAAGAKRCLPLPVSAPFHSSLMKPAAEALRGVLAGITFHEPQITVLNNIDVASPTQSGDIKDALYRQAFGPVRWVECVTAIQARGVAALIECGPGKVLSGMSKRICPDLGHASIFDPASLAEARALVA